MTTMNNYRPPTAEEKLTMSPIDRLSKWLELKIYQLEVTMSVYMFTPMEKFIFCTSGHTHLSLPLGGLLIEGK